MSTNLHDPLHDRGFTLIEILMALVILAVGLLSLQALAIGAVRLVAIGEKNSRAAVVATRYVEDAVEQLRRGVVPQDCTNLQVANGDQVTRVVTPGVSSQVVVTVTPRGTGANLQPYTAQSFVYSQQIPSTAGRACPAS